MLISGVSEYANKTGLLEFPLFFPGKFYRARLQYNNAASGWLPRHSVHTCSEQAVQGVNLY